MGLEILPWKWAVGVRERLVVVVLSFFAMSGCAVTASASVRSMKDGCCAEHQRDVNGTGGGSDKDLPRWGLRL